MTGKHCSINHKIPTDDTKRKYWGKVYGGATFGGYSGFKFGGNIWGLLCV